MSDAAPSLRIGTWNLEYAAGVAKNHRRKAILQAQNADIWVLTETHDTINLAPSHSPAYSDQRANRRQGERWATIWSRGAVLKPLPVEDPHRTTAALVESAVGTVLIYATVLPWCNDRGPDPANPAKGWSEFYRVLPRQFAEWSALQAAHPEAALVVAGDLNMNLGGPHYYGTKRGRQLLRDGFQQLELTCTTEWPRIPEGSLRYPPIDHVLVTAAWREYTKVISCWEGRAEDGTRLSDHSGLVVEFTPSPAPLCAEDH